MNKHNKKASMQLSINMIVILIIAVVILGLALGFVQGMFGKMSKTFEQEASAEPDAPSATPSNPLTMSKAGANIIASPGEEILIKWSYYCANADTANVLLECVLITDTLTVVCTDLTITPNSAAKNIPEGSSKQVLSKIVIAKDASTGTFLCLAKLGDFDKDLTIKVI